MATGAELKALVEGAPIGSGASGADIKALVGSTPAVQAPTQPTPAPQPMEAPVQQLATDVAGTDVAGRMMGRGTFAATGGAVGTALGLVAGPVGGVVGGTLGVMGGSAAYDSTNELIRWLSGEEQPGPALDRLSKTVQFMTSEGAFDAATMGVMRLFAPAARAVGRALTGVPESIAPAVQRAQGLGIEPTVESVGSRARAITSATGRLPFAGSERGAKRIMQQVDEVVEGLADNLGAPLTRDEAANLVALGGRERALGAMKVIDSAYDRFRKLVKLKGNPQNFPTKPIAQVGKQYVRELGLQEVIPSGKPTDQDIVQLVNFKKAQTFLHGLSMLEVTDLTAPQLQALQKAAYRLQLQAGPARPGELPRDPLAFQALGQVDAAVRQSMEKSPNLAIAEAAREANDMHTKFLEFVNQPALSEFRAAVPGIAETEVFIRPRSKEAQDLLDTLVREQSPTNLRAVHQLIGDEAFGQIRRRQIMKMLGDGITQTDIGLKIDGPALRQSLGIDNREGLERLETLLAGSDVNVGDVRRLVEALETVGDQFLPNVSQFMTRSLMLRTASSGASPGARGLIANMMLAGAGGSAAAAGGATALSGVLSTLLPLRLMNEALGSRRMLNMMLKTVEAHKANRPIEQFVRRMFAEIERAGEEEPQATRQKQQSETQLELAVP